MYVSGAGAGEQYAFVVCMYVCLYLSSANAGEKHTCVLFVCMHVYIFVCQMQMQVNSMHV